MSERSVHLLSVGILEGRHFPKFKSDIDVYIEAKFGYKSLVTDPIQATEKPVFNCELCYEISKKDFHLHRLNRTPVKLQLFTQCQSSIGFPSPVGQIVLDLKQAKEQPLEKPIWFPVLHCKHRGSRPEILISFYLDTPKCKIKPEAIRQVPDMIFTPESSLPNNSTNLGDLESYTTPKSTEEIWNDEILLNKNGGYFIFKKDGDVGKLIRLTVTLVFAERLEILKPSIFIPEPFCFVYYIFGNRVSSEPFQNLDQPDFPSERATVRIKCLWSTITKYITDLQYLEILLISGANQTAGTVLAKAKVPLLSLLSNGIAEGLYFIGEKFANAPLQDSPCVGVSVVLSSDEAQCEDGHVDLNNSSVQRENCGLTCKSQEESRSQNPENISTNENPNKESSFASDKIVCDGDNVYLNDENESKVLKRKDDTNVTAYNNENSSLVKPNAYNDISSISSHSNSTKNNRNETKMVSSRNDEILLEENTSGKIVENVEKVIDIETHTLDNNESSFSTLIDVPIHFCLSFDLRLIKFITLPMPGPCLVQYSYPFVGTTEYTKTSSFSAKPEKTIISDGQRTFCFVTSFSRLQKVFSTLPLTLELMCDSTNVGLAHVSLEPLLHAPTTFFSQSEHVQGHRSTFAKDLSFMNLESATVAKVSVLLSLDRLDGKADSSCDMHLQSKQLSLTEINEAGNSSQDGVPDTKHFTEKSEEQHKKWEEWYRSELIKREEEWKKKDTERELLLQTRLTECLRLEEKLRKAMFDVESKHQTLQKKEEELRIQESEVKRKTEECERRLVEQQSEKKQDSETENFLRIQVKFLEKELTDSKKVLQKALSSKLKYKKMWCSTFKELVTTRNQIPSLPSVPQLMESSDKSVVKNETALEECPTLEQETLDPESSRDSLPNLDNDSEISTVSTLSPVHSSQGNTSLIDEEYIQKLVDERDMLLKTGSYSTGNPVIQQLDRHIKIARSSL